MKSFTELNPKRVGLIAVAVILVLIVGILFLNRSIFQSGYQVTARFPNAAGISKGTDVMVAGVNVGTVTKVALHGNSVDATMSVNVPLPHQTTAAIEVETLLGVVDVTLEPVSGWSHPLKSGTLITKTTVPTEFYQLQNNVHALLSKTNAKALNNLIQSLATITKGKQTQVAQIISGLGKLTNTVNQRSTQVSSLIDSANTLSSTLAGRDQELLTIVNNLNTVSTGLAEHSTDLANLITDVDAMATQTNSLVTTDSPALNSLLENLHSVLGVVGQHQEDLAEGVTYLGSALKGFASIAYDGNQQVSWANIYVNATSLTQTFGVIGPCGALDDVLNEVLGPDPTSCDNQTGPLPGEGSNAAPANSANAANGTSTTTVTTKSNAKTSHAAAGPNTGLGALLQPLAPVLGGVEVVDTLRAIVDSKIARFALAGIIVIAAVVVAINLTESGPTYPLSAVYGTAPGLFPGAAVDVLGVKVGTVTAVKNVGDHVDVSMLVNASTRVPAKAVASLVAPQLLGQPDIDLNPGYTGGPKLSPHAVIPESCTSVPVSTDTVLKELQHTLNALNPHAVGDLITNLAQDLDGQGAGLNKLIASAAGTIQLLANKGDDLGQLNGTLAQLTGTLDSDTSQIEQLVTEYDTVSTVLAQHSGQLNDAITQLAGASTSLVNLLVPNLTPLEADVGTVTTVGRTLDRNLDAVDEILAQGNNLFQGAERAYDPTYNWLTLNLATSPGVTGAYVAGLLRDRLAGICRRITANHATGLTTAELASLASCGNPDSTFFDPLLNEIPTILDTLTGVSSSETGAALLQKGVNQIMNIAPGATTGTGTSSTNSTTTTAPKSTTTTTTAPKSTTTTTTSPSTCTLLSKLLGCTGGATSKSKTPTTTKNGLGGLLSNVVSTSQAPQPTVALAASRSSAQLLTPAAASMLPPLPSDHHAKAHHRGLLGQWTHDVESWF